MDEPGVLPTQPLFDLTGMSVDDAKNYVLSLTAHLKQTEADFAATQEELRLWEGRVALAEQRGLTELKSQAETKRDETSARKTKLELEIWEFRDGVEKLKKQLLLLPLTQRTVNTDALLENLATLGGPLDSVSPTVKRFEAEDALAALKKRLAEGS